MVPLKNARLANRRLVIVGAGVVGRALGKQLREAGLPVAAVISRDLARARAAARFIGEGKPTTDLAAAASCNLVMIATIDRVLGKTARNLATACSFGPGTVAFHCSGAFASDAIDALRSKHVDVGSFHPLQAFASPEEGLVLLPGSTFTIEGNARALAVLEPLARAAGGRPVRVRAREKALYHAAAAITSNCMVAVAHLGTTMLGAVPAFAKDPFTPLRSLLRGTLRNLERLGPRDALTGPIVRGDVETIAAHLAALGRAGKGLLPAYRLAARVTLEAALASGRIDRSIAKKVLALLDAGVAS